MSAFVWILTGAVIIAALAGSGKQKKAPAAEAGKEPYRIDHPHVIEDDDYECSVCRRRFRRNVMVCPECGARFMKRVTDENEFLDEEDELDAWDEEDGL